MHRRSTARRCSPFPAVRLRAARTLIFSQGPEGLSGCNFLSREEFACDADLLRLLGDAPEWEMPERMSDRFGGLDAETLQALVSMTVLVEEGSALSRREDLFLREWKWGMPTALMHFCLDGADILPVAENERRQRLKAETVPSPPLWQTNSLYAEVKALPRAGQDDALLSLMAKRRTVREAGGIVSLGELSDCLFAGMGITGETENCVGKLPLSMTPSGGARNPFEAYVFARAVAGLEPGIYHYSATEHSLGRLPAKSCPDLASLVGDQDWAAGMPALIVLVAVLERPMWKYEDGNAYRVMLIEAGHIGQNVALAATSHGLTACPTAAVSHARVRECLDSCAVMEAPVYALALGRR